MLDTLIPCLLHSPEGTIANVLRRMAQDYPNTKDGYPDLMVVENHQLRFEGNQISGGCIAPQSACQY